MTRNSSFGEEPSPLPSPGVPGEGKYFVIVAFALLALLAAVAPTLTWQEFTSGPENLVVATALEIRRGDCGWLLPTLQGEPRIAKPPLTTWITAACIRQSTVRELSSRNPQVRSDAYRALAWQVRLPALLTSCLLLIGIFELGRAIRDAELGMYSAAICATSYLFLRFCRYATTDLDLATCVVWANAFLAQAIIRGRWWRGCIGAGIALGLAMLSKGPIALVQTAVPFIIWRAICRGDTCAAHRAEGATGEKSLAPTLTALSIGAVLMVGIGLPWYVYALTHVAGASDRWATELARSDIAESSIGPVYQYLLIVGYVLPWTPLLIVGVIAALRDKRRGEMLAVMLAFVPLLIMTFFRDREDRYALPIIPAAAVVSAIGLTALRWKPQTAIVAAVAAVTLVGQLVMFRQYARSDHGQSGMRPIADQIVQACPDAVAYNAHPRGKRPPTDLGVYLNRIIRWVPDAQQISTSDRPQVLFMLQDKGEPEPVPPAGFRLLGKVPRGRDWWYTFVRE